MNFDEKDIEFFKNFEDEEYKSTKNEFLSLNNEWLNLRKHKLLNGRKLSQLRQALQDFVNPNCMYQHFGVDILSIYTSSNLMNIVDPEKTGNLITELQVLRVKLTKKYGYVIPNIRIVEDSTLENNSFEIHVHNKNVYRGKLSDEDAEQNNPREIIKSLYKVCFDYVHYIMTRTDALKLMELVRSQDPPLVNDTVPSYIPLCDFQHICANLIQRKVGIKDIVFVFAILNKNVRYTQDVNELTDIIEKELSLPIK